MCAKTIIEDSIYVVRPMVSNCESTGLKVCASWSQIVKFTELAEVPHEKVAGMLLYAQTEEEGKFNNEYQMMGNRICVRTLDLSGDFQSIKDQLDEIAEKYLLAKVM